MPTFTTRLGLQMDLESENYDVDVVNANLQKIDANLGAVLCTSTTRPSSPYPGQTIYETDTGMFGLWRQDLASWVIPRAAIYSATSRPTTGLYPGYTIFRTDKGFYETYDGSVWRVRSYVTVASTSDITNPYQGQTVFRTSDLWELWWNGTSWIPIRPMGPPPQIEMRQNAPLGITTGGDRKLTYDTVVTTGIDITYSAGNFTMGRAGTYLVALQSRQSVMAQTYLWFAKSNESRGNRGKTSSGTGLNRSSTAIVRAAAGEAWSAYFWTDTNLSLVRETGGAVADDYSNYISISFLSSL